jgi:hypothetical protein
VTAQTCTRRARELPAAEAVAHGRRVAFAKNTAAQAQSDFIQRRIAGHSAVAAAGRRLGRTIGVRK